MIGVALVNDRTSPLPMALAATRLIVNGEAVDDVRAELLAGRPHAACGLLLNRAIELIGLGAAVTAAPPRTH